MKITPRTLPAVVALAGAICAGTPQPVLAQAASSLDKGSGGSVPALSSSKGQAYPTKPVRVVIAFGPGGIADTIGRLVGQKLHDRFGQPIVGDNRPGAGGALAAKLVAGATPDGYTLLVTTTAIAVNATAVKDAVDPRTQLIPVAITASAPTIFVVHRSVAAKTLLEYVRTAKKGRFNYGTAGVGTTEHLTSEYTFSRRCRDWSRRTSRTRVARRR